MSPFPLPTNAAKNLTPFEPWANRRRLTLMVGIRPQTTTTMVAAFGHVADYDFDDLAVAAT